MQMFLQAQDAHFALLNTLVCSMRVHSMWFIPIKWGYTKRKSAPSTPPCALQ